jgi:hypothetical protein
MRKFCKSAATADAKAPLNQPPNGAILIGTRQETEIAATHWKQRANKFLTGTDSHFFLSVKRAREMSIRSIVREGSPKKAPKHFCSALARRASIAGRGVPQRTGLGSVTTRKGRWWTTTETRRSGTRGGRGFTTEARRSARRHGCATGRGRGSAETPGRLPPRAVHESERAASRARLAHGRFR